MNCMALSSKSTRILYIPPYYEDEFELTSNRLRNDNKHVNFEIYSIDKKFSITNCNYLLSMCRSIINEEHIQMLISDSSIGQLIVTKLCQEYPQIYNRGMNFLSTLFCINRFLIIELFSTDECLPTICINMIDDYEKNLQRIETFLLNNNINGYMKSLYSFDNQSSSIRFSCVKEKKDIIEKYIERYKQQFKTNLLPLFRVYISEKQYPLLFQSSYLVQPFFDLTTYPYWRLLIANACIYDKEIIMWPLVDGYSGWPFIGEKPLAIMPIMICPSRQITHEQQNLIYACFRKHLHHLIENCHLRFGWIQCTYFISCKNEIRLVSIKPTYSIYLTEAFNSTVEYGSPIVALIQLSNRQRPSTPILNGKTVYIHRLWMNNQDNHCINHLINMNEIKRIHRSTISANHYVRLRFQENHIIKNDKDQNYFIDIGFIQVNGEYFELGLINLIEFRYKLLLKPELFPFAHHSMLSNNPYQFDPKTCLPSNELLKQLENMKENDLV